MLASFGLFAIVAAVTPFAWTIWWVAADVAERAHTRRQPMTAPVARAASASAIEERYDLAA
jgi:hypothetical protein